MPALLLANLADMMRMADVMWAMHFMRCCMAATGLQRSQALRSALRRRRCIHLGLEQVLPAGPWKAYSKGVCAMYGQHTGCKDRGCELWLVAYLVPGGSMIKSLRA